MVTVTVDAAAGVVGVVGAGAAGATGAAATGVGVVGVDDPPPQFHAAKAPNNATAAAGGNECRIQ
jgi:hypothetical protein